MRDIQVHISMLGGFSVRYETHEITDKDNRARKVWQLLAYLVYHRNRLLSQDELFHLLWGNDHNVNPPNALKTVLHRVRATLDQLHPSMGHQLILRRNGCYIWNPDVHTTVDVESFETLCRACENEADPNQRLELQRSALQLYHGDFLPAFSSKSWVIPIATYFNNLYSTLVTDTLKTLEHREQHRDIVALCQSALNITPYDEQLYQFLMRGLLAMGQHQGTIAAYQELSQMLYNNFGVIPSDESRAIYREATRTHNSVAISLEVVREQLREDVGSPGAMLCDFDFFKKLYHKEARAVVRTGDAVHLAFFCVTDMKHQPLARRSLDLCMDNLEQCISRNLRRSDIFSRYSASQFILLISQSNYENTVKVCERIRKNFFRQYPHSPAALHYSVQPLEPSY